MAARAAGATGGDTTGGSGAGAGGAAMMYASPPATSPTDEGRVRCPSDAELLRPVSGGAQREAFLRAERCVRREIARGTRLTAIR